VKFSGQTIPLRNFPRKIDHVVADHKASELLTDSDRPLAFINRSIVASRVHVCGCRCACVFLLRDYTRQPHAEDFVLC